MTFSSAVIVHKNEHKLSARSDMLAQGVRCLLRILLHLDIGNFSILNRLEVK